MRIQKRRTVIVGLIIATGILLVAGLLAWWLTNQNTRKAPTSTTSNSAETIAPKIPETPHIRFAAMGDMLAHDSVVNNAKTDSGYDFTKYFTRIKSLYSDADIVFCNPETLAAGSAFGITGYPTFNAPTEFARDLNSVGCNLINLATNHIGDKGQAAINATLDTWQKLPILAVSGANRDATEQNTVSYFSKNGLKVAFVAFADFSNNKAVTSYGLNSYHDGALVKKLLGEARNNADVVIVSAHWGTEDSNTVNADQIAATQLFASLGVDVVIGTGPHVLQKISSVSRPDGNTTLVWYSIGNMLSSQLKNDELTSGVAGFTIEKNAGKILVKDITFKSTFMGYDWPVADRAAGKLETRSNLALYPLGEAAGPVTKTGTSLSEREQYVKSTLGSDVTLTISP